MAVSATMALTSCGGGGNTTKYASGSVTLACDASFRNIMEQEIQVFEYKYPQTSVLDRYMTENEAMDSLIAGNVKMAVTTRPLDKKEIAYLKSQDRMVSQEAIAVDAIALIVNPENPMDEIDHQDIVDILIGKYTSWDKIVPHDGQLKDISVVFDGNGSSTVRYMRDSLLNGAMFGPNVFAQKSPDDVFRVVSKNINAIGVIGVSWITTDMKAREMTAEEMTRVAERDDTTSTSFSSAIKVLAVQPEGKLKAYLPYQLNIYNGDYPFYRQVYLISTSSPHSVGASFFSFVTSAVGQKIILTTGVCPKMIHAQFVSLD